jgi:hypothetical protein
MGLAPLADRYAASAQYDSAIAECIRQRPQTDAQLLRVYLKTLRLTEAITLTTANVALRSQVRLCLLAEVCDFDLCSDCLGDRSKPDGFALTLRRF